VDIPVKYILRAIGFLPKPESVSYSSRWIAVAIDIPPPLTLADYSKPRRIGNTDNIVHVRFEKTNNGKEWALADVGL
jgi:hypothetical protein